MIGVVAPNCICLDVVYSARTKLQEQDHDPIPRAQQQRTPEITKKEEKRIDLPRAGGWVGESTEWVSETDSAMC